MKKQNLNEHRFFKPSANEITRLFIFIFLWFWSAEFGRRRRFFNRLISRGRILFSSNRFRFRTNITSAKKELTAVIVIRAWKNQRMRECRRRRRASIVIRRFTRLRRCSNPCGRVSNRANRFIGRGCIICRILFISIIRFTLPKVSAVRELPRAN